MTIVPKADGRIRRVAENEALYRQVNERIKSLSPERTATGAFGVICECATLACNTSIMITPEIYERTRAHSDHFIVLPGHQLDDIEIVIEDHESFFVIEKTPEEAKRIAAEMDPRD